jgi:Putative bacterial sensory transduction regulator
MVRGLLALAAVTLCVAGARPAQAEICATEVICASNPQGMVDAIRALGYKAVLEKDSDGNPEISTAASGYDYSIYFDDCDNHVNCSAIQFYISFAKDPANSEKLANDWNLTRRMGKMYFDPKDGSITMDYELSTAGGLNQKNFADVVAWWEASLGELQTFFREHPAPK